MTAHLNLPESGSKKKIYEAILPQVKAIIDGEKDLIANMANTTAILRWAFDFLWVGFYLVKDGELILGPFQGPVACTRISFGKGVCGSSWKKGETIIVPDVDKFPGHIACSSESRSEIVVPGIDNREVVFVLDIDSQELNTFDDTDSHFLELIVAELIERSQ